MGAKGGKEENWNQGFKYTPLKKPKGLWHKIKRIFSKNEVDYFYKKKKNMND